MEIELLLILGQAGDPNPQTLMLYYQLLFKY